MKIQAIFAQVLPAQWRSFFARTILARIFGEQNFQNVCHELKRLQRAVSKDTWSSEAAEAVAPCPPPAGVRGQDLPFWEDVWAFFLYSIYNKRSQDYIFQPSENPNITDFPLGQTMAGPSIRHWVWENRMKLFYAILMLS